MRSTDELEELDELRRSVAKLDSKSGGMIVFTRDELEKVMSSHLENNWRERA